MPASFELFKRKMEDAGLSSAAVDAFARNYGLLAGGETTLIPEESIVPAGDLPSLDDIRAVRGVSGAKDAGEMLAATVIIKLNGGLGTGMGLAKAKSLLEVRDGFTFLDLIARQVLGLREKYDAEVGFLLMDSYATSADTLKYLEKYPALGGKRNLELMQNRVPKIDAGTLAPAEYPDQPELEWCPPGHGDLYPSLLGTGWLDLLLARGVKVAFVSNSDNLGATLDLDLLGYFIESDKPFLMEVTPRTAADRKGGHLAVDREKGHFVLRESAQCPEADVDSFQDISRHRYFNTNNLWIRLDRLKELLDAHGGIIPLPMMVNSKTVDPRDAGSASVYQLETAMGAAIQCFDGAGAVVVARNRFAPVKTTDDLMALRSDAYVLTEDSRLELAESRAGIPPVVTLDPDWFKLVDQLEESIEAGPPSLAGCTELRVTGPVAFSGDVILKGKVAIENPGPERVAVPPGVIEDAEVAL